LTSSRITLKKFTRNPAAVYCRDAALPLEAGARCRITGRPSETRAVDDRLGSDAAA
jgi:hypothetical protein